jgi:hypothetical protein
LKAAAEKLGKQLEQRLDELFIRLEETSRQNTELGTAKAKLQQESGALATQIEELESQIAQSFLHLKLNSKNFKKK